MDKYILDTNAILRFILKDVKPQYLKIFDLIKKAKTKKVEVVIPEIIVFETIFTLKSYYEYTKEVQIKVLESLLTSEYLQIENKQTFNEAIKIFRSSNLSLVDCFLIAKSITSNAKLFSFDLALNKKIQKLS